MKTLLIIASALLLLYWLLAHVYRPGLARSQRSPEEIFELYVGEWVLDVKLDEPFEFITPGGETLEMVLRRKAILRYTDKRIAFSYPSALQLHRETTNGVTTLTLEGNASPLVLIQVYPPPNSPEGVLETLVEAFEGEYRSRQARFLPGHKSPVERHLAGAARPGRQLTYELGGEQFITELYAFPKNGRVVAVILQHNVAETRLAESYFAVIAGSLN